MISAFSSAFEQVVPVCTDLHEEHESPRRVVGFHSISPSLSGSSSGTESPRSSGSEASPQVSRASSLGQQLRQQQAGQVQPLTTRLSIRTAATRKSGRLGVQARPPMRPSQTAAQCCAAAAAELHPCDATLPSGSGMAMVRQQSNNVEIPRLTKARTCPTELDDDMVAAALEACTMHAPVHAPPAPALAEAVLPPALGMLGRASSQGEGFALRRAESHAPALWQQLNSAQRGYSSGGSSSSGSGCASRASSMRVPSTQEQLFAARADAAQSHAQVQCLQDALAKERELVATLYSELHSMTTQNGKLKRRVVLMGGSGAPALATAAPCPQASTCEAGMAACVSPFGGFSPFTPGRNSP